MPAAISSMPVPPWFSLIMGILTPIIEGAAKPPKSGNGFEEKR
jgi:hypothetical protein